MTDEARFMAKVNKHGPRFGNRGRCHDWTGRRDEDGYGRFWIHGKMVRAGRWAYEHWVGPIPEGLTIDHLCKRPSCVRPTHLEPVTMKVNILRGSSFSAKLAQQTHCIHNHQLAGDNFYIRPADGSRICRTCSRERQARYRRRQRAA